jgi:glucosamine--fructose-6-phosphate aminotransferase (isomerizing)
LNTLVGHLWGYYAALSINESSKFLYEFRNGIQETIDAHAEKGLDIFEMVLEKSFRETILSFYTKFRKRKNEKGNPTPITLASDLILLMKYLSGRLPAADFELDFNQKGTARNMLDTFFRYMGESINSMSRPVDAIKHQAKTVTVGTSRISEKIEGILFDALKDFGIGISQLTNSNIVVMRNLQGVVKAINGAIYYTIDGVNLLGEPTDDTTIRIVKKTGILAPIPSRVESDFSLKGTKRIIVRQGNVYIGKGRKDGRSILVIPVISTSPEKPNIIENLLLLNIGFKEDCSMAVRIKALGGKYEHIKSIVQENSIPWEDAYLDLVPMDDLYGLSAEKVGEMIGAKTS